MRFFSRGANKVKSNKSNNFILASTPDPAEMYSEFSCIGITFFVYPIQPVITCSKLTIETLD